MKQYYNDVMESFISFCAIYIFIFYAIELYIQVIYGYSIIRDYFSYYKYPEYFSRLVIMPSITSPIPIFVYLHYRFNKEKINRYFKVFERENLQKRKRNGRLVIGFITVIIISLFLTIIL